MASTEGQFHAATWLFLRLLGLVYLLAFWSFGVQVPGLIGANGILPAAELMEWASRSEISWHQLPTLCWISAGDGFLAALWIAGVVLSLLVIFAVLEPLALFGCWLLYLSLVSVGRTWMAFQWDNLLLEVGFAAIFLAPIAWRTGRALPAPPLLMVRLFHLLAFRLSFSSGIAKFTSGDQAWSGLSALRFHFETQPLPTALGWYWHQWPAWFHSASVIAVIVLQVFLPFLFLGPWWARRTAAFGTLGMQGLIALTGNYGFFNLVAMAMCVLALDDALLRWPRWERSGVPLSRARRGLTGAVAAALLAGNLAVLGRTVDLVEARWLEPIGAFRSLNGYGLFAVMTTRRVEIVLEGRRDGEDWQAYELFHKPGDLARRPSFVAPHMPRLDWQMWFAALGSAEQNRWIYALADRLLAGRPEVSALFAHDPFRGSAPRYLRARSYDYRFTSFEERRATGAWWRRTELGEYLAPRTR